MKRYSVLPNHDGFIVGLYENEEGEYVKYSDIEQLIENLENCRSAMKYNFDKLTEANSQLIQERNRYRDALNVIAKETIDIGIHDIAEKALEGEK
jgi:hypothetical protein